MSNKARTVKSKKNKQPCAKKRYHNVREMLDCACKENSAMPAFYFKTGTKYRSITFARLRSDIRSLGASLLHRGLHGKKIILIGENCYHWSLAYLTILCGLGVIIPINKESPEQDICSIAKISGASAVIYSTKYEKKVSTLPKKLQKISFDELPSLCEQGMSFSDKELHEVDSLSIDIDSLASVIFTAGTMGISKGVMLSQRNICSALEGLAHTLPDQKGGITLALLPLHYVYESISGLLAPLSRGSAIAFSEGIRSAMQNAKEISPTSIVCTPSVIEKLYKKIWANIAKRGIEEKVKKIIKITDAIKIKELRISAKKKLFAEIHESFGGRLEFIMIGGAPIDPDAVIGMAAFGFNIIQSYGLSECTSLVAITPENPKKSSAIGKVIPVGELKITDADGNGVGEICYRGDNVMLGYYKQDELNKEVKKNGWIHTGDLGSIDDEGYLTVMGRKKNAISVFNSKQVFPEELETIILRNGYVKECAVIGIKNEDKGSNDVVAVIFPDYAYSREVLGVYSSRPMIREKLGVVIADMNARLPAHKRISYFVLLEEEIPKNAYKKIERSTLPEYVSREYLAFER